MNPSEAEFWQAGVRRRPKDTPCPKLVWAYICAANRRSEPWQETRDEWARKPLRVIARSPIIFPSKNPDLKSSLKELDLEWLKPGQISRIRECAAPRRKVPRDLFDRQFSHFRDGVDPVSPKTRPKCKMLFWAWRHDQKTCDAHSWAASMLRVEKHNKAKKDRRRNALQLKDARAELKRARRKRRREKRQAEKLAQAAARPATSAQLKARNDRADLQLLNWVRLRYELETIDPARLEAMIRDGYVVPEPEEPQAHRITGQGLQRIKILRQTVGRGPGTI
jgi:hypothetical protein